MVGKVEKSDERGGKMEREAAKSIKEWLDHGKEALLVTGARQIGKTSLIRECLRAENVPFVEINFIEQQDLIRMFDKAKNAKDLLFRLSAVAGKPLKKHETVFSWTRYRECRGRYRCIWIPMI